jgi:hypothetical protein
MKDWPGMTKVLGLESEPCSGEWSLLKVLDSLTLDRKIHAPGLNFFFMAAEVKVIFFGAPGAVKILNALRRILGKVKQQNFNGLEVTAIVAKCFLGVPYDIVSAHSRHVQQRCYLEGAEERQISQHNGEWAKS